MSAEPINAQGELWRELFDSAVKRLGAVAVGKRLGYANHTLISRVYAGRIPGNPKLQEKVLAAFHTVACPHTQREQPRSECQRAHSAPPTHNPGAMAHWRACQRCPNKPEKGGQS